MRGPKRSARSTQLSKSPSLRYGLRRSRNRDGWRNANPREFRGRSLRGKVLRCNDGGGDPLEVSPGAPPGGESAAPPQWTDPTSPPDYQGETHVRYVDTLDLRHMLIGICAAGDVRWTPAVSKSSRPDSGLRLRGPVGVGRCLRCYSSARALALSSSFHSLTCSSVSTRTSTCVAAFCANTKTIASLGSRDGTGRYACPQSPRDGGAASS